MEKADSRMSMMQKSVDTILSIFSTGYFTGSGEEAILQVREGVIGFKL